MAEKKLDPSLLHSLQVAQSSLSVMQEQYERALSDVQQQGKKLVDTKTEYTKLKQTLDQMSNKCSIKNVMVPMGKKAFMRADIAHANDILVLLGDNWFIKKSAKGASEICDRRLERVQGQIDDCKKEMKLINDWLEEAKKLGSQSEGNMEIREEYNEESEKEWRKEHRESVRKAKLEERLSRQNDANGNYDSEESNEEEDEDDEFWRRLEELEAEEELRNNQNPNEMPQKGKLKTESDVSPKMNVSPKPFKKFNEETSGNKDAKIKRKVSFGAVDFNDDTIEKKTESWPSEKEPIQIRFRFTPGSALVKEVKPQSNGNLPNLHLTPSDLYPNKKTILKPFDPSSIKVKKEVKPVPPEPQVRSEPLENPVKDVIVERSSDTRKPNNQEKGVKEEKKSVNEAQKPKVSLFKKMKMKEAANMQD